VALAKALLAHADEDHGFTIEITAPSTVIVHRGDRSRFRLWRALFELRHPGPSKRQGHTHTVGRKNRGTIRVPPGMLCEAAATGIPGERVQIGAIEGWGSAVPMVDDYADTLDQGEILVVSAEGITAIDAPRGRWARLKARFRLIVAFDRIDASRSAALTEQGERAQAYVRDMERLGFRTSFEGRRTPGTVALPVVLDPLTYLVTLGANSLAHMAIVLAMLLCVLYGRVAYALRTARRNRATIPLVVGGWGTRGKSGTERIKAGLFQGLGVSLLSKTTGCEAMILHGPPLGRAIELFLFRPFDKATIWEQTDVIALAAGFESRVMLWECMGLNPKYVEILQAWWMRDDLSTLTNAYPDHEDIQGPSGIDVATVIGGFCAPGGKVMTTEDPNMLPVLRERARERKATFFAVPVAERTLYADDLLARMPYAEHPSNVALAARIGTTLGVDRVEAIGLMAENVVPDLGALIIYPETKHLERKVTFINGMSANDFLSWRNNWKRIGFETHDHDANPGTFLMSVVNNRADRVPRSRVFARIVVMNANAHRHVLIGTNLSGFKNYVDEALDEKLRDVHLDGSVEVVDRLYAHLRIGDAGAIGAACARAVGADEAACAAWVAAVADAAAPSRPDLAEAQRMAEALEPAMKALEAASPGSASLAVGIATNLRRETWRWLALRAARAHPSDPAVLTLYRQLTHDGILFIMDSSTSGDRIIQQALELVPPGSTVRLMGIQNIKGTGLDFAYQWVFWRELHRDIQGLGDPKMRDRALVAIEQNPFGSVFSCDEALKALAPWREDPVLQTRVQAIARRIEDKRKSLLHARVATVSKSGPWARFLWLVERLVDPFDAVLRKRRARQVFEDLIHQRIAHSTAQDELQRLTKRQKGGWLKP
jgi:poly-gamma-glutamate synthase PgsB/CapB